jgi:hypothetical protein
MPDFHPLAVIAKSVASAQNRIKPDASLNAKCDRFPLPRLKKTIVAIATINFCAAQ